jgi:hypothetical protein
MAWRFLGAALIATALFRTVVAPVAAQSPTRPSIAPVYEGFWRNADGSYELMFGYFNRSWDDIIDVPVGPANSLDPGGPDQAQPTHFFPRRNRFVFKVHVPADFGNKEVVWTLTVNGETQKAYGTLKPAYAVDENVLMANFGGGGQSGFSPDMVGNKPPKLTIEGSRTIAAKVGVPVSLSAVATDDGKLTTRSLPTYFLGEGHFAPMAATGLRFAWFVYRGAGRVEFDPPQTDVWEDTRDGSNSPWSIGWKVPPVPPGNRWTVRATFAEPGTYVLRAQAHDGGLMDYGDVTVTVTK